MPELKLEEVESSNLVLKWNRDNRLPLYFVLDELGDRHYDLLVFSELQPKNVPDVEIREKSQQSFAPIYYNTLEESFYGFRGCIGNIDLRRNESKHDLLNKMRSLVLNCINNRYWISELNKP
ncbi:MAG: hypothetical protein PHH54_05400 [Candidatus Nanoarchaeia archaeon]|nr:hypothetical protein [Candidatus Nanoarchaeia archaeon]MDD5741394.1 hypothetical protein [Candidatus Nanoarchaeia archaeon]